MKIGIVGGGVVGRATARAFIEHVDEVRVYDKVKERATHTLAETLFPSDLVFVCLPTPQKVGSLECDVSAVWDFFAELEGTLFTSRNFVLRSTIPIGTTKKIAEHFKFSNLVHSPEFLTARCAVTDAHLPSRNIIGSVGSTPCRMLLEKVYQDRFPGVLVYSMTSDESEAVKLFLNGFFATKVAYWNEVNALTTKLGLDWDRVMEGVLSDGRVSHSHTKVPGPDGKFGFGGECLVKDLNSLTYQLVNNGCDDLVTSSVAIRNKRDRERSE